MRCAIYARYSSDLQRESSIEDQIRRCRDYAEQQGWSIVHEFVRADRAVSGATLVGRDALQSLIEDAKRRPRPFDCLLVDDTSRFGRDLPDVLNQVAILDFYRVRFVAVSQGIHSDQKSARQVLTLHGMVDEQYLVGLADKVHRGQEGQVLKGLQPGGRCYGYRNVPIEDPVRTEKYGRSAILGVQLEINEEEAQVVRRIFRMYAEGTGYARIAKQLNAEDVPSPQPPRTRPIRAWAPSSIRQMLRNERYRGIHVWNRTQKVRNPETGRKTSRPRPENAWKRVEVPKWRIVPEELWQAAHAQIAFVNAKLGGKRQGGMCRTENSRQYLFSGLLVCGVCGSRLVIVSGRGKRGYVKYGCPSHRYRGTCPNKLTIRQDRLEDQMLAALEERIFKPEMIEYLIRRFESQLQERLRDLRRRERTGGLEKLQEEQRELEDKISRIVAAIAAAGHSDMLLTELKKLESERANVKERLAAHRWTPTTPKSADVRKFVAGRILGLRQNLGRRFSSRKGGPGQAH